jgi:uncharacterized protein (DUF305 family)
MTLGKIGRFGWRRPVLALGITLGLVAAFLLGRASDAPGSAGVLAGRPSPVDIGFAQDMGTHHQQAILMSSLAAGRAGPAVKALAEAILVSQSQELGALQGWLRLWDQPGESATPMSWMSGAIPQHTDMANMEMPPIGSMPGMASSEELTTLWARSGTDFDILFLQLMTRHHQGGIEMAQYAEAHATLDVVHQAARAMQFQQAEDIGQMQALLKTYGATPLPPP